MFITCCGRTFEKRLSHQLSKGLEGTSRWFRSAGAVSGVSMLLFGHFVPNGGRISALLVPGPCGEMALGMGAEELPHLLKIPLKLKPRSFMPETTLPQVFLGGNYFEV
jgi:hypothetical protein